VFQSIQVNSPLMENCVFRVQITAKTIVFSTFFKSVIIFFRLDIVTHFMQLHFFLKKIERQKEREEENILELIPEWTLLDNSTKL
jgi:hypothetical protein